ncbi:MAG: argininosuccinate lyase [Candidatus Omnitrophota bacterium]|jgi:argininosuccinate lyase
MEKKLWGGRFEKDTDPLVEEFTKSVQYDKRLAKYDLLGSMLHAKILEKNGYLNSSEADSLSREMDTMFDMIENNKFNFDEKCEDIHTQIQNILQHKLGETALKLHMARSRNDQVVFATKMYCKELIVEIQDAISILSSAIQETIDNNDIIVPGFTHMQHAQPVYLKDYLGVYKEMLKRDIDRLDYIKKNIKITMGAGALAGTPISSSEYNICVSELLNDAKFKDFKEEFNLEPTSNSLDAVSDRDFVIEIINALSIVAMHLSRLSEDLVIWSTKEFGFVEIDDAFCTGSSLMPQKKNPDVLELTRGYAGRLYGNLVSVLTMMKGLPLTYNRDMQLDKEPLFNSFDIIFQELKVLNGLVKTLRFNREKISVHLEDESLYATDLVYYLVKKGVPFKKAHTLVGELIKYSIDKNIQIKAIPEDLLKEKLSDKIVKKDILELFDPRKSVESKLSIKR